MKYVDSTGAYFLEYVMGVVLFDWRDSRGGHDGIKPVYDAQDLGPFLGGGGGGEHFTRAPRAEIF